MADIDIKRVAPTELADIIQLFTEQVYPNHPEDSHRHFAGHAEGYRRTVPSAWVTGSLAGDPPFAGNPIIALPAQQNIPLIHHLGVFPEFQRQRQFASRLMDAGRRN